jgi:hypothetical protein
LTSRKNQWRIKQLQTIELYKKDKKEYNGSTEQNKDKPCLMACTVINLKAVVKIKNKKDGAMSNIKRGIKNLYAKCMERKGELVVIEAPTGSTVTEGTVTCSTAPNDNIKTTI